VWKGAVREGVAFHETDRRTAVEIDTGQRLLWMAVFENAFAARVARILAKQGSQDGFLLDGGHSTTMVLDRKAAQFQSGALIRSGRPVATVFGVRAEPKARER
jgi:hypothetical protein